MKVLTANRLIDGEAVWFARGGYWSESIEPSEIAQDGQDEVRLEAIGRTAGERNEVVDVSLIDVDVIDDEIVPRRLRERIRAAGPTNRLDLGKQARPRIIPEPQPS